jgi:PII-like signaling protein
MREEFAASMLRIHFNGEDKSQGMPLQEAILEASRSQEMMFAIAYRGVEGFGSSARIHRQTALSGAKTAPVMMTIIDRPEKINQFMPLLDRTVEEGLIAISSVEVIRLTKDDSATGNP